MKDIIMLFIIAGLSACVTSKVDDPRTADRPIGSSKVDDSCMADHPIDSSEDVESDPLFTLCAVPAAPPPHIQAESEPVECEGPTVEDIELDCEREGYPCDGAIQVSYDAAICIAEHDGRLSGGIDGPYAYLVYNSGWNRPIWVVMMVEEGIIGGEGNGATLSIDAETGEVLEMNFWLAQS